eukprot:CAMPEP_0117442602 /NCGR_PEP_ID=MMETSP0759-20121206/4241_1 /TAXON_ID=63605 /ORGANISM="Percolomonas cosmopolitus, Strain WS" /LENGTH=750 /DNA_ID=CAMNT_0005234505 /DNA_START=559 /DNA_END=2811 /DNA_ORIENTATION=+
MATFVSVALLLLSIAPAPAHALGKWPHNLSSTFGWIGYIALTSIVFVVPFIGCLCCIAFMSSGWVVRRHFLDEGRFLKRQIYVCLLPFTCLYLLLCVLSLVLGIIYLAHTINFMSVKDLGFTMGNHLITVPRSLNSSMNEVFDAFQMGVTQGRNQEALLDTVSTQVAEMNQYFTEARIVVADRDDELIGMIQTVDQIDQRLSNMSQYSFPSDAFGRSAKYDFANESDYVTMIQKASILWSAQSGGSQIADELSGYIDAHRSAVDAYESDLNARFIPAREGFHTMVDSLAAFLDKYVTDFLTNYDLFSVLTAITLAIIIVGFLFISPFVCASNFYAVFKMNHKILKTTVCCSCFSSGFFLFIFACFLCGYSVVYDACEEVTLFHRKAETIREAVAFKDGFQKISIPVDLSDMILKLQQCDSSTTYVEAAGVADPDSWTIESTMSTFAQNLSASYGVFNTSLVAYTQQQLIEYSSEFRTPTADVSETAASMSSDLKEYYEEYMLNTYNYSVSQVETAKSNINDITESNLGMTFTYRNILELNTSIAPFSTNLTSSQLTTLDEWRPILVEEREAMQATPVLVPLTENFAAIRTLLSTLSSFTSDVSVLLRSYAKANVTAQQSNSWINIHDSSVASSMALPSSLAQSTRWAIGNSSTLSCAPLGTYVSRSNKVMCADFAFTTLLTAIMSLFLGVLYIFLFFTLLCTHYRVEFLSELPYKMKTVKPFKKRNKFSMGNFGGVNGNDGHVELQDAAM